MARIHRGTVWYCAGSGDQDNPQEKEMQKGKMVASGGLTNSRAPKNSKEG